MEIITGKYLYTNSSLESDQQRKLIQMIQGQSDTSSWDYSDMKGIHPDTYIHHIYTNDQIRPVRNPQIRMNPTLKRHSERRAPKTLACQFHLPYFR